MPIINNTSDIAKLLERNRASNKFYIGHSLYRTYQKRTMTYFGEGQLAMEFVYHGEACTHPERTSNNYVSIYTCRFTNNLPTLFMPAFGTISALTMLTFIDRRIDNYNMLRRLMSTTCLSKSDVGFEVICRMLKIMYHYQQYIKHSKYNTLLCNLLYSSKFHIKQSNTCRVSLIDINLTHDGSFILDYHE